MGEFDIRNLHRSPKLETEVITHMSLLCTLWWLLTDSWIQITGNIPGKYLLGPCLKGALASLFYESFFLQINLVNCILLNNGQSLPKPVSDHPVKALRCSSKKAWDQASLSFTAHQWLHLFITYHSSPLLATAGLYFLSKGSQAGERPRGNKSPTVNCLPHCSLKGVNANFHLMGISWKRKSAFPSLHWVRWGVILVFWKSCEAASDIYGNICLCVKLLAMWNSAFR